MDRVVAIELLCHVFLDVSPLALLVGPLALGLDAEMGTPFLGDDLDLPAPDEPRYDLRRVSCGVGAEQRLVLEVVLGIAGQNPSDRHPW